MIYIVQGEEEYFINDKIKQICSQIDSEIIKFDGNDKSCSINNILEACNGNALFGNKNIVLVKDAPFLVKKVNEEDINKVLEYINNPLFETDLVFYTLENKHNSKLKCYKEIAKNAQVIDLNRYDYKNFNLYINQQINLNKIDISNDAIFLLNSICKRSATLLHANLELLKLYPGKITKEVIEKLCTVSDDNNAFEMINALTSKNISKTIEIERKMLNENESIMSVIGLLASQLRFLYQLSYLIDKGYKKREILEETKCSEFRYNKALETLKKLNSSQILDLLSKLSEIDIKCKTDNSVSDQSRFELYILDLMK